MRSLWETMLLRWLGGPSAVAAAAAPIGVPWADLPARKAVGRLDAPAAEPAGSRDVAIADEAASFGVG
jgi:hypothetical protein